jgi:Fic family protein
MAYQPQFTISPKLLGLVETIAVLRERIQNASVELSWIPALQKDTRTRNVHASTAIEGNPLTLEEVRDLEAGRDLQGSDVRSKREVLNYFAGLRYIERRLDAGAVHHDDVFELHRILADEVMDQGEAGRYRTIAVRVGDYLPPVPQDVSGLMFELLEWWNRDARQLSPVLSSAILHYQFEAIHPFADGNGRTGRALALWELYRRGFDTHHIFSVDEYYWEDRPAYYQALRDVRLQGEDLTGWLEYSASGLQRILERVWERVQSYQMKAPAKFVLRPRQEQLLQLLKLRGGMAPSEIWEALQISKQGSLDLLNPLIEVGLVERVGTRKKGYYQLIAHD